MKEPNERDREEISDDLETSSFQIPPPPSLPIGTPLLTRAKKWRQESQNRNVISTLKIQNFWAFSEYFKAMLVIHSVISTEWCSRPTTEIMTETVTRTARWYGKVLGGTKTVATPISMGCIFHVWIRQEWTGTIGKMLGKPSCKRLRWKYGHFRNTLVQGHNLHNIVKV
jgi:hypothetical protein